MFTLCELAKKVDIPLSHAANFCLLINFPNSSGDK